MVADRASAALIRDVLGNLRGIFLIFLYLDKHRRLDIIVVPYEEDGCALVYFTGSAHLSRSLRHLCKKMNLSLNEHALKTGVDRKGAEKIYEDTTIPTPTEESMFKH